MIEHIEVTYWAFDGTIFEDEMECLAYEMNLLYEKSGVRFTHKNGKEFKRIDIENSYDSAYGVKIDRSKDKENEIFISTAIKYCGWTLLDSIKSGSTTKYRFDFDKVIPLN